MGTAGGVYCGFGPEKLESERSVERFISRDRCSNTYRPFLVVSLIAVVFAVLTMPFTRNATIATIRMQATPSVTTVSTMVKPTWGGFLRGPP